MDLLEIQGNKPLQGTVEVAGAKNAISKMLVASLISDQPATFFNVPNILEVELTVNLCRTIGMDILWDRDAKMIQAQTRKIECTNIPLQFSGATRIPILMLGALLGRVRNPIIIPTIGGCKIGKRPVDFHLMALEKLGAHIQPRVINKQNAYFGHAPEGLTGAVITLPYPSVMATENAILAACQAKGITTLHNAAMEPEVFDLILFLQKLGMIIHVDVNRTIYIKEAHHFYPVEHTILPDRIEAACFAMAALSTKGRVLVKGAEQAHMITFLNKLREIGGGFNIKQEGIEFFYDKPLVGGLHLETDVHPGFLTDWLQPFVVLLTQAQGTSVVHETVYENRFGYIHTLKEMGADISLFNQCLGDRKCRFASQNYQHSLIVKGPTPFREKTIEIPDLRAGFAYVMAALIAPGTSQISGLHFLDRGYENLEKKLSSLGANIKRITNSPSRSPSPPLILSIP